MAKIIQSTTSLFKDFKINNFLVNSIKIAEKLDKGKYEKIIFDDDIFSIPQNTILKKSMDCVYESHKEYIDIHVVVSGAEAVELVDVSDTKSPYEENLENDYYLYKNSLNPKKIILNNQRITILFFDDVHKVGIEISTQIDSVIKVVLKIKKTRFDKEFINE